MGEQWAWRFKNNLFNILTKYKAVILVHLFRARKNESTDLFLRYVICTLWRLSTLCMNFLWCWTVHTMRLQLLTAVQTQSWHKVGCSVELRLIPPAHKVRLYGHFFFFSVAQEEMSQIGEHTTNAAFTAVNGEWSFFNMNSTFIHLVQFLL